MKRYRFGKDSDHSRYTIIPAANFEQAKKLFAVEVLFPENHVDDEYYERGENGYPIQEYSSTLGRTLYRIKDGAKISVFEAEARDDLHYLKIKDREPDFEIPLFDFIHVDFQAMFPISRLPSPEGIEPADNAGSLIASPQARDVGITGDIASMNKIALRNTYDEIQKKKAEMEQAIQSLRELEQALAAELHEKRRMIYMLETYLGVNEQIVQLSDGAKASDQIPIAVYQELLYMDEEVAINDPLDQSVDFSTIDTFDDWIINNADIFIPGEKGVCAFRVRRNSINYNTDAFSSAAMNKENMKTYFLIKNGETLYRIYSNVQIGEKLFPATDEYEKLMSDAQHNEYHTDRLKERHYRYLYVFIALQGMVERTDIFGTRLRKEKVNLITGEFTDAHITLIRDAEKSYWLTDSHPTWSAFITGNRESIAVGSRVMVTKRHLRDEDDKGHWRTNFGPRIYHLPFNQVFSILDDDEHVSIHGPLLRIIWNPKDSMWGEQGEYTRKRGFSVYLYRDEVLNIDGITLEDIEYYLTCRLYRKDYEDLFPSLLAARKVLLSEQTYETDLIALIINRNNLSHDAAEHIYYAIRWWKIKNKWKRNVAADDAKAMRMIESRLRQVGVINDQ
jgi:hypothetical protein